MTHQGTMHQSNSTSQVSVSLPSQDVKQKEVETKAVNSATTTIESSTHPQSRESEKPSLFKIQFTFGRPLQQDQGKAAIPTAAARTSSFFSSFDRTDLDMKVQRDIVRNYNRKRLLERNSAVFAQTTSSIKNHEIFILAILEEAKYFHQRKFCSIVAAQSSNSSDDHHEVREQQQQQQDEKHERHEEEEDPSLFSPVIGIDAFDGEEIRISLPSSGPFFQKEAEGSGRVDHKVVQEQMKKKKIEDVPYLRRLEAEYETVFKNLLTLRKFVRQTFINAANVEVAAVADSSQQHPADPVVIDPYSQTFASITKFRLFQQIVL